MLVRLRQVLVGESIVKKKDPTAGIVELFGKDIASFSFGDSVCE